MAVILAAGSGTAHGRAQGAAADRGRVLPGPRRARCSRVPAWPPWSRSWAPRCLAAVARRRARPRESRLLVNPRPEDGHALLDPARPGRSRGRGRRRGPAAPRGPSAGGAGHRRPRRRGPRRRGADRGPEPRRAPRAPGRFARETWAALRAAPAARGARAVLSDHPEWVVHVPGDPGCVLGIDTPADYERWIAGVSP